MKIAVLSGKGGTGKTFISVNLASVSQPSVYVDCDVEAPNGRLFFKPDDINQTEVSVSMPRFDENKCTGCRECVSFCQFHALVYIKEKPMIFEDVCHSCGGCAIVCKECAITEQEHQVGLVEHGVKEQVQVVTGIMNMGEVSGVPVIKKTLHKATELQSVNHTETIIVDCPPGSSCAVMESIMNVDYCVIVVEPTAFGFHNFQMVYELVSLLQKPCGIVINKEEQPYMPLEVFCEEQQITILKRIPYSDEIAKLVASGGIISQMDSVMKGMFRELYTDISREVLS